MKQPIIKCDFCGKSRYRLFWHRYVSVYDIIIKGNQVNNKKLLSDRGNDYYICTECLIKKFNFKLVMLPITTKIYDVKKDKYVW